MTELYDTYGTIMPQSLSSAKAKLEVFVYNHSCLLAKLFTAIHEYSNMSEASGATKTPE